MNHNARIFCFLVFTLAALGGCSSGPTAGESKKSGTPLDRIQGKAQVLVESGGATDAALNAGGPSVYIWEGTRRYRLFLKTAVEITHGSEYVAEGVYAQKAIDEIGDPDQGKNGYPLEASCQHVVRMAWGALSFDLIDAQSSVLRTRVKRYPARPVFLVTRIRALTAAESSAASADKKKEATVDDESVPEVAVAWDKQRALLVEGPTVQPAPLWEPAGGTASCKVIINSEGKISSLETGAQLCETVEWSKFRFQPPVKGGHPAKVRTEIEVRFEARK
jgi:hypothetical protein